MSDDREAEAASILDRMANPHPRMWRVALAAYAARAEAPVYWQGVLDAMCAATGYEPSHFVQKLDSESA